MERWFRRPRPEVVALLARVERGEISRGQAAVEAGVDPTTIAQWQSLVEAAPAQPSAFAEVHRSERLQAYIHGRARMRAARGVGGVDGEDRPSSTGAHPANGAVLWPEPEGNGVGAVQGSAVRDRASRTRESPCSQGMGSAGVPPASGGDLSRGAGARQSGLARPASLQVRVSGGHPAASVPQKRPTGGPAPSAGAQGGAACLAPPQRVGESPRDLRRLRADHAAQRKLIEGLRAELVRLEELLLR